MSETKRQKLPAGLWVVATPIGNLEDLSSRARLALETAQAVLCEDTRRTAALLSAIGVQARCERFDHHSSPAQIRALIKRLEEGESFALVSDAGTPSVSDPGSNLVAAAWQAGVRVTPVPGPSAVTTLVSVAGVSASSFTFRGFFPRKEAEKVQVLDEAKSELPGCLHVWFESPERIEATLGALAAHHPKAWVIAAKELTKLHERVFRGEAQEVAEQVASEIAHEGRLGEWCLGLVFPGEKKGAESQESSDWVKTLQCLLNAQVSASRAAKEVSQCFGVPRNRVYDEALRLAGKKSSEGG